MSAVRVELPQHLRTLASLAGPLTVDVQSAVTIRSVIDAVENAYPMLRGTIREHQSGRRRDFVRFFVCGEDMSLASVDDELPSAIARGDEPFLVVGAIAGG